MPEATDLPSSSRALVPLIACASPDDEPHRPIRRAATFVTQLIANAQQVPQARENRRADPAEVIAAYQATIERIRELNNQ